MHDTWYPNLNTINSSVVGVIVFLSIYFLIGVATKVAVELDRSSIAVEKDDYEK